MARGLGEEVRIGLRLPVDGPRVGFAKEPRDLTELSLEMAERVYRRGRNDLPSCHHGH